jgi:16S rRNA (adenine1518-N6/adenine1519-N6)-dimethyltransferase
MRAKKRFGQNFLQNKAVIARIVEALGLRQGDSVVEIGPGLGALTELILEKGVDLTSIEIDRELTPLLKSRFGREPNFRLIEGDFLSLDLETALEPHGPGIKVVGNLPYYISTPILERLIQAPFKMERLVLMLQLEVVERITAPPGTSDRGYFTVLVENAFETEKLLTVPPGAFRPAPAVHSAVVRMVPKVRTIEDNATFRSLIAAAFAQKRKTILNNLRRVSPAASEWLTAAGIDPGRRAETLSLHEWKRLLDRFDEITPVQ